MRAALPKRCQWSVIERDGVPTAFVRDPDTLKTTFIATANSLTGAAIVVLALWRAGTMRVGQLQPTCENDCVL